MLRVRVGEFPKSALFNAALCAGIFKFYREEWDLNGEVITWDREFITSLDSFLLHGNIEKIPPCMQKIIYAWLEYEENLSLNPNAPKDRILESLDSLLLQSLGGVVCKM